MVMPKQQQVDDRRDGKVLPTDLHWCLVRVARGLGAAEHEVVQRHGLSLHGYVVLAELHDSPTRNQLALSRASMIDKSTMVRVLDDLEQEGYVRRTPDPADRRARLVELTDAGSKVLLEAADALARFEDDVLAPFPAAERAGFRSVLTALAAGPYAASYDPVRAAV